MIPRGKLEEGYLSSKFREEEVLSSPREEGFGPEAAGRAEEEFGFEFGFGLGFGFEGRLEEEASL